MSHLPVLMYHSASDLTGTAHPQLGVPEALLAAHLASMHSVGYHVTGLTDALFQRDLDPNAPVVALTFDDAYVDFLEVALPLLGRCGSSATLYVPTAHVGGLAGWLGTRGRGFPRLLTWDELMHVRDAGVEIGSHARTHTPLDVLPLPHVEDEVGGSRHELQSRLGVPADSLCYPHGYHSRLVEDVVQRAGYGNACEVGRRLRSSSHRFAISRLAVGPGHSPDRLLHEIRSGGPLIEPALKRASTPAWRAVRRTAMRLAST